MNKRRIAAGETLALESKAIQRDADGFFFLVGGPPVPPNHRHASYPDVAIVYVRGSLEHHNDAGADNYEAILCRMRDAFSGQDVAEGGDATPPSAVIMCIDSRGGVVSGLNETVAAIRKLRKASEIPLIAYVNEMAASAAYAMACACDEILCPKSAIMGSVGTISTMCSRSEADKQEGLDVRLLTSGARKADGHPHAPITDAAEAAEQERVDKLAESFFELASQARGMGPDKFKALQAAIFLGPDAKKKGLADAVVSLDDLAGALSKSPGKGPAAKGNETDRKAALDTPAQVVSSQTAASGTPRHEANMSVALKAMIATAEAALASATDEAKKGKIQRRLDAFRLTLKAEEGGDDDSDDEDDDDSKAAKQAKKAEKAKKMAEAAKHRARAEEYKKKAAEAEEEAEKAEADDEEEEESEEEKAAKAALAAARVSAVATSPAATVDPTVVALARTVREQGAELDRIRANSVATERAALVARAERYIPKHILEPIAASANLATLRAVVAEAEKGQPMVATEEGDLLRSKVATPGTEESLPKDIRESIDPVVSAYPGDNKAKAAFRDQLVKAHIEQQQRLALNGAGGRI